MSKAPYQQNPTERYLRILRIAAAAQTSAKEYLGLIQTSRNEKELEENLLKKLKEKGVTL